MFSGSGDAITVGQPLRVKPQYNARMPVCDIQQDLLTKITAILEGIGSLNRQQIGAIEQRDHVRLLRLDKELENVFGDKEKAFVAYVRIGMSTAANASNRRL